VGVVVVISVVVPLFVIATVSIVLFWLWKKHKAGHISAGSDTLAAGEGVGKVHQKPVLYTAASRTEIYTHSTRDLNNLMQPYELGGGLVI